MSSAHRQTSYLSRISWIYLWRKFCQVEKFQISVKNLNNLWRFIEIYADFVLNLCGEKLYGEKMTNMRSPKETLFGWWRREPLRKTCRRSFQQNSQFSDTLFPILVGRKLASWKTKEEKLHFFL